MSEKYVKLEDTKALLWQIAGFDFDGELKITDANELLRRIENLPVAENVVEVTFCKKCKYHEDTSKMPPWHKDGAPGKYLICKVHNMYKKEDDFCSDGAEEDGDG